MTTTTAPAPHATDPSASHRLRWFVADSVALTGRGLRHQTRELDGLITSVAVPVMLLLLFVYVFGGAIQTGTDYLHYVVPGIIVLAASFGAATTAVAVTADLTTGAIDRFRSLPMSPAALFAGHVTTTLIRTLGSTVLVIGLAIAIGFRPTTRPLAWLGVVAVVAMAVTAIAWISVTIGIAARSVEAANGFSFFVIFLPYLSSAFVPPETLPTVLRPLAEHQPITPIIETMRGLLLDQPVGPAAWRSVLWCAAIVTVAVPTSVVMFRRRTRR